MPDLTPAARYDLPWKTALTHALRDFMRLFFPKYCHQIDWSKKPRFHDKELEGIGFGAAPDFMVADKLVEVCLRDGGTQWLLIHIEIQAQRDGSLAERIFDYNYRIFKEFGRPVASLVVLADDDPNWRPDAFHYEVFGTTMGISFATVKLLDYADRIAELQASQNPICLVAAAHLLTQQARHDADQLFAVKWQLTTRLCHRRSSRKRILMLFKVINWMMVLPEPYQKRYMQATIQLGKEHNVEWITQFEQSLMDQGRQDGLAEGMKKGLQKGLQQGLQQGLEQGRREGAQVLLERLLERRFGPLPKTIRNKLDKASLQQLEAWGDALPQAQSLWQVFQ